MVNYKNGKIYKIISNKTDKIYIGSTTKKYLCDRLAIHRAEYKRYKTGKIKKYITSFKLIEYDDAKIILIENYQCNTKDELRQREQYWIDQNKDFYINKNNAFGHDKEKIAKKNKKYYNKHKEEILKQQKIYKNMPKKCLYCDIISTKNYIATHKKTIKHKENCKYFKNILK